ncbi:MAG: ATP-grasp domain-containing protein, partial [Coriobacteriales bacterium]|nr:ATP-grasp domain-containing protein [Coriobacteriales bacterium]
MTDQHEFAKQADAMLTCAEQSNQAFFENVVDGPDRRIALLVGGHSAEREVSIASGACVERALDRAGHTVRIFDPAQPYLAQQLEEWAPEVVFIALHGKGGEDGRIQGFLETIDLAYTGSGVLASALAMDKGKSKIFYRQANLPTPPSCTIRRDAKIDDLAQYIQESIGIPCVLKPIAEGSSIGVYIIHDPSELKSAVNNAFTAHEQVLVER